MSDLSSMELIGSLNDVNLVLFGEPDTAYLSVFLKDPQSPGTYRFRKMHLVEGVFADGEVLKTVGNALQYLDIETMRITEFIDRNFSAAELSIALRVVKAGEDMVGKDPDPAISRMKAVVGTAEYRGRERMGVEGLASLAALKYYALMLARQGRGL